MFTVMDYPFSYYGKISGKQFLSMAALKWKAPTEHVIHRGHEKDQKDNYNIKK